MNRVLGTVALVAIVMFLVSCDREKEIPKPDEEIIEIGYEDTTLKAIEANVIAFKEGTEVAQGESDDGAVVLRLNNSSTGISCACPCGAPSVCQMVVDLPGGTATCSGSCSGIDPSGFPCSGCRWKTINMPTPSIFNFGAAARIDRNE